MTEEQVLDWKLPPAPVKSGDARAAKWDGFGQVELDAVDVDVMQKLVKDAADEVFDWDKHDELLEREEEEQENYRKALKQHVIELSEERDDDEED